jgi:hypothetical protein
MRRTTITVTAVAAALAYGEVRFNQGYGTGADTDQCVIAAFQSSDPHTTPKACEGIWINPVSYWLRLTWIKAIGQEVPSKDNGDGTWMVGANSLTPTAEVKP